MRRLGFRYNDGGRAAAGYRGDAGDCVVRAIAIATERPYADVYQELTDLAVAKRARARRKVHPTARNGVHRNVFDPYLANLGWRFVATMGIGTGCRVHLRADELPPGRLIVSVSRHLVAIIDGVIHDTYNCDREGTRCVYGYYTREG